MMRFANRAPVFALLGVGCTAPMLGCGSQNDAGADETGENAGSIDLALETSALTLKSITYSIAGPNAYLNTGNIDETNSELISTIVGGIPVGSGYTVTLSAIDSVNPSTSCAGSATFDVAAHATTSVQVRLDCRVPATTGSVLVNGSLNVCPIIDSLTITPAEVTLSHAVGLIAAASDKDSGPSPLTYTWTAIAIDSSNPSMGPNFPFATGANTTYSCIFPGPVQITLTVSDGDCTDAQTNTILCLPPPGIGPPGASGQGGGSGT